MKQKFLITIIAFGFFLTSNAQPEQKMINNQVIKDITSILSNKSEISERVIERGVTQAAQLWRSSDGTVDDFVQFCKENFCKTYQEKEKLFNRLSNNFELILGHNNRVIIELLKPTQVVGYEQFSVDDIFGSYDALSHFNEDMFNNKIAFIVTLNFPFFTLKEKEQNGKKWSDVEWGYVRLGDIFTSRIEASYLQRINTAISNAETYIASYNIPMGRIVGDHWIKYWSDDIHLISHWGLRDEIKACYADPVNGLEKQILIFNAMRQIINQKIPTEVLDDNKDYLWFPPSNGLFLNTIEIFSNPEPNTRYQHLLNIFQAMKAADKYYPNYPTYISRKFDGEFEISLQEAEKLFTTLVSSPQVKEVAQLISKRLNRKLQPFDIWYDGFKTRSVLDQQMLDEVTKAKYPNKEALQKDLPNILVKLGFTQEKADYICQYIAVDPSVGAGHAWGAMMKSDVSMLRTRFTPTGMDYKGYNIGIHEFGHNVEQTISLHDVSNYFLSGVPNTAFSEALAFTFQSKDLDFLGITTPDSTTQYYQTLDVFWGCYEIMGVSLVDMKVWQWMYNNPNCNAEELKNAVIAIAREVWNQYYAPVFGIADQSILAIYSHMINTPLYLSAYPIGHIIDFQLGQYLKEKNLGMEIERIYSLGRLSPNVWMSKAVGKDISVTPLLTETSNAVKIVAEIDKKKKSSKK